MFNPIDKSQVRAMVDYRREQVIADAKEGPGLIDDRRKDVRSIERARVAVGFRVIRVGARIAGVYAQEHPRLHPGV